jgi:hypothetical protein
MNGSDFSCCVNKPQNKPHSVLKTSAEISVMSLLLLPDWLQDGISPIGGINIFPRFRIGQQKKGYSNHPQQ